MVDKRVALVIGCGSIGQRHARLLGERDDITIWACDPDASNLAEAKRHAPIARTFSDYEAALKEGPDLAWVCTPNKYHAPAAIAALRASAHVLCEKPLSDTLEAGRAIVDAVQETGQVLQVGYMMHFWPGFQLIERVLAEGRIGNVIGTRMRLHGYRALEWARSDFRKYERAALLFDYSHELDYLRWLVGPIVEAKAMATTMGRREKIIHPNVVAGVLRFAGGQVGTVHFDYVQRPDERELDIFADDGRIYFNATQGIVRLYTGQEGEYEEFDCLPADYDDPYRAEIQAFLDAVDGKRAPAVSAQDGLDVLETTFALVESYEGSGG